MKNPESIGIDVRKDNLKQLVDDTELVRAGMMAALGAAHESVCKILIATGHEAACNDVSQVMDILIKEASL